MGLKKYVTLTSDDKMGNVVGIKEVNSLKELSKTVLESNWSPYIYKDSKRKGDNFERGYYFALDVDEGMSIEEAKKYLSNYNCFIATTKSHNVEKNGKIEERFRIVFELAEPLTTKEEVTATFLTLKKLFPAADDACKDAARYFFRCKDVVYIHEDGMSLRKTQYQINEEKQVVNGSAQSMAKLPLSRKTRDFIAFGSEIQKGNRHPAMIKVFPDFVQQLWPYEEVRDMLSKKISWWDDHAEKVLEDHYRNRRAKYPPRIPQANVGEVEELPEHWVYNWLKDSNVTVSYNGMVGFNGEQVGTDYILARMRTDRTNEGLPQKVFSDRLISDVFHIWLKKRMAEIVESIKKELQYKPELHEAATKELERLQDILFANKRSEDLAVLRHFMWQAKRKMFGGKVEYHIMPVLLGPSGGGKSEVLKRFIKPLQDVAISLNDMNVITDSRETFMLIKYFVIAFEELGKAQQQDVNTLKNKITADTVTYRVLGSNAAVTGPQNATFIGSSNTSIIDLIKDPTSARRYYEIQCNYIPESRYAEINSIDWKLLWIGAANETEDSSPIRPFLKGVGQIQNDEIRHKDTVEQFFYDTLEVDETGKGMGVSEVYHLYKDYCDKSGQKWPLPRDQFGRSMLRFSPRLDVRTKKDRVVLGVKLLDGMESTTAFVAKRYDN